MKRVLRFGRDMMPSVKKEKTTFSKKPRLFRRLKKIAIKMETLRMQKDLEDGA
jgi:hypothetical protein